MDELRRLQEWYLAQCDGDWEHQFGPRISTLDNPGWSIAIDLVRTPCENVPFPEVKEERSPHDWMYCRVQGATWCADGGPRTLETMLRLFLDWAEANAHAPPT